MKRKKKNSRNRTSSGRWSPRVSVPKESLSNKSNRGINGMPETIEKLLNSSVPPPEVVDQELISDPEKKEPEVELPIMEEKCNQKKMPVSDIVDLEKKIANPVTVVDDASDDAIKIDTAQGLSEVDQRKEIEAFILIPPPRVPIRRAVGFNKKFQCDNCSTVFAYPSHLSLHQKSCAPGLENVTAKLDMEKIHSPGNQTNTASTSVIGKSDFSDSKVPEGLSDTLEDEVVTKDSARVELKKLSVVLKRIVHPNAKSSNATPEHGLDLGETSGQVVPISPTMETPIAILPETIPVVDPPTTEVQASSEEVPVPTVVLLSSPVHVAEKSSQKTKPKRTPSSPLQLHPCNFCTAVFLNESLLKAHTRSNHRISWAISLKFPGKSPRFSHGPPWCRTDFR